MTAFSKMTSQMTSLNLWESSDFLWLEAAQNKSLPVMSISRGLNPQIKLGAQTATIPGSAVKRSIQGILGILQFPLTTFLVAINQKRKVGEIEGQVVYRLESVEFIPISTISPQSSAEIDAQKRCQSLVENALSTPSYYFTYQGGDLTNTKQRQSLTLPDSGDSDWKKADKRFLWNYHMGSSLLNLANSGDRSKVAPFLVLLIHGAVYIHRCSINGKSFVWALVSRRSRFQTGTRFFARGSDRNGNVANFCETEQIVEYEGQVASYVQTRGSMPFLWGQIPCIKYMPMPKVYGTEQENKTVLAAHFHEQVAFYGEQVIINLVNSVTNKKKKYEGQLEDKFRKLIIDLNQNDVHYEAFDFHKECSKMRYDRLVLLKDQLAKYSFGYFHKIGSAVGSNQKGVFRTNCMDCLDRTNVVQSYMNKEALADILSKLGLLRSNSIAELEQNEAFLQTYRNSWADHGNLISIQYAGTGALKTDFTRTGVRTHWGLLQDGWNSAIRYVKNNFKDGQRTDGIKFLIGELSTNDLVEVESLKRKKVANSEQSPIIYLPYILLAVVVLMALNLLTASGLNWRMFGLSGVYIFLVYLFFQLLVHNSTEFVDYPSSVLLSRQRNRQN